MYLAIFDESTRPRAEKIAAAAEAFTLRYGVAPSVVLVNEADAHPTATVSALVRRNNFYAGMTPARG